ncbi:stage II sporulation protein M [Staphylococcus chromogenes]|uniref:stage II sporulation protein M n=1 Tax=Staphylococcus chromogenes TaxID=46126 RepID=UPI0028867CB6|nr:stage II sporulation protein M [Staphylococcus chromogenes]MDT0700737.1 stage II sporulation protein M [Staphylococcus chromogenes]
MNNIVNSEYIKRAIKIFFIMTILLILTIILAFFLFPTEEIVKELGNKVPKRVSETDGLIKVWGFIQTNAFYVPLQMLILALIPIPFLYMANLIVSIVILGIMFGFLLNFDSYKDFTSILAYIPHYTFEIMGLCVVASGLYTLNQVIIRMITNLFRKRQKARYSLKQCIFDLSKMYLLISIPLIIIAAFIETYIANLLFNLMN